MASKTHSNPDGSESPAENSDDKAKKAKGPKATDKPKSSFNEQDLASARKRLQQIVPKKKFSRKEFRELIRADIRDALQRGVQLEQLGPELLELEISLPDYFLKTLKPSAKTENPG